MTVYFRFSLQQVRFEREEGLQQGVRQALGVHDGTACPLTPTNILLPNPPYVKDILLPNTPYVKDILLPNPSYVKIFFTSYGFYGGTKGLKN